MRSIRARLLTAFLGVIAILTLASSVFFLFNWKTTEEYRRLIETMIVEYRLVDQTSLLIETYNVQIQSSGTDSENLSTRLTDAKREIDALTSYLDIHVTDRQSRSDYLGFKSSIVRLVELIDTSLQKSSQGDITDYFTDFNEANKQHGFVQVNGTALIFSQLQYSNQLQQEIDRAYFLGTLLGLSGLVILIFGSIFLVVRFATKLTRPLRTLTEVAQKIAGGDMEIAIDEHSFEDTSEIHILARSFKDMTNELKRSQEDLQKKAAESEERAAELAEKLTEIERMNKHMVDREIKMMELKTELKTLKAGQSGEALNK